MLDPMPNLADPSVIGDETAMTRIALQDSDLAPQETHGSYGDPSLSQHDAAGSGSPQSTPMAPGVGGFNIAPPAGRENRRDVIATRSGDVSGHDLKTLDFEPQPLVARGKALRALRVWGGRSSILLSATLMLGLLALALSTPFDGARQQIRELWASQPWLELFHAPGPHARLLIESPKGSANEPLQLGIALEGASGGETITVTGLASGTELSLGKILQSGAWVVADADIDKTFVGPPPDFVGTMSATVTLHSPNGRLLDRQPLQLEWIAIEAAGRA